MNILVTGGAGYIGTNLSNTLSRLGHNVFVIDICWYPTKFTYPVSLHVGDIRNYDFVDNFFKYRQIDVVYHLAAMSNDPSGNLNRMVTLDINWWATKHLIDTARDNGVKKFIFASSSSVLGIQKESADENTPVNPITVYSETKAKAEEYILSLASNDFVTTAIRPATVCGVSPRQRFDLTVNILTISGFVNGEIKIFGGQQRRPNLAMHDMIKIYQNMLHYDDELINGEVFNAGWENSKVVDIGISIQKLLKDSFNKWVNLSMLKNTDDRDYYITSAKIEKKLGFHPEWTYLEEACMICNNFNVKNPFTQSDFHNIKKMEEIRH